MIKRPRQKNDKHLDFIRGLPCVVCLNNIETEAAHLRSTHALAAKRPTGMQEKPDDAWTIPLRSEHHRKQHKASEAVFFHSHGIDPYKTAAYLWQASGDHERGKQIIVHAKDRI